MILFSQIIVNLRANFKLAVFKLHINYNDHTNKQSVKKCNYNMNIVGVVQMADMPRTFVVFSWLIMMEEIILGKKYRPFSKMCWFFGWNIFISVVHRLHCYHYRTSFPIGSTVAMVTASNQKQFIDQSINRILV